MKHIQSRLLQSPTNRIKKSYQAVVVIAIISTIFIMGCTRYDAVRIVRIATSRDISSAAQVAAKGKAIQYVSNPKALGNDIKSLKKLIKELTKAIGGNWGNDEIILPSPKKYVKYTQNYKSRAMVDFDNGIVTVETVDTQSPLKSLREAIIITLLTPNDPRAVDLYSSKAIELGSTPFLLGEVLDFDGKPIRWNWRAERFADTLLKKDLHKRNGNGKKQIHYVTIPMVQDHLYVRAAKYKTLVKTSAKHFKVSPNLIYAIMKVESDFNPFAISHAMAVGLMQVVPKTAGSDVYAMLHGKKGKPTPKSLLDPKTNITYGTGYLHMLQNRFLAGISDPVSREYCVIAAYNGGPGAVLRIFDNNKKKAARKINAMGPMRVYNQLEKKLPRYETRRYLVKVLHAKKDFINNTL